MIRVSPKFGRGRSSNPAARGAFTLIELLIVIAIILILIAIALPNFLEAQIRAKVTKVKAELRSLATAIESYGIDYNNRYPASPVSQMFGDPTALADTWRITTPVAYITAVPFDTFVPEDREPGRGGLFGIDGRYLHYINDPLLGEVWITFSFGPDGDIEEPQQIDYSPTNGSKSNGDVYQVGAPQHNP